MKREREQGVPEARKEGLVVQHLSDEVLIYDQRRHKGHCLNQTAALVWKHCDGKTSVSEMTHLLEEELKTPVKEEVVWLALEQLGKTHLLNKRVTLFAAGYDTARGDETNGSGCGGSITGGNEHRGPDSSASGNM